MMRVHERGVAIELEVWSLDAQGFGRFVSRVPPPLCIGTIELDDGRRASGFLCEPHALDGRDRYLQVRRLAVVFAFVELDARERNPRSFESIIAQSSGARPVAPPVVWSGAGAGVRLPWQRVRRA